MVISVPEDVNESNSGQQTVGITNTIQTPQHCDSVATFTHINSRLIHHVIDIEQPGSLHPVPLIISDNNIGCHHHMVTRSQIGNIKPKISFSFSVVITSTVDPTSYSQATKYPH